MRIPHLALGLAALCLFAAKPAMAQDELGKAGGFVVAAERVMGFTHTEMKLKGTRTVGNGPNPAVVDYTYKQTWDQFDFLGKGDVTDPWVAPRIGFDYFIIDGLSLGGSIVYASTSTDGSVDVGNTSNDLDKVDSTAFVIAPRVGYAFMFTPVVGLWPRGGLSYWSITQDTNPPGNNPTDEFKASGLTFSAEAMLVIAPVEHAAFLVGPTLDFPILSGGTDEQGNRSDDFDDVKITTYGIQAGVGVWF
jgi:hypothetical protein